ncbi:MAG: hypothetical protein ACPHDT_06135 [Acidimicrobiales bacterium]
MTPIRTVFGALRVLISRPSLWATAIVQARRFVPDGWWRRPPFLPVPDAELLAFRASTQYGDPEHPASAADLVAWLEWCRAEARR